jgi:hypothetical protein
MYERNFRITDLNIENFKGQFVDNLMKVDPKYSHEYDSFDKPYALFKHISGSSRFQYKLIKAQMEQVDPLTESELYKTLYSLAAYFLKLWILSTESVRSLEMFLDWEA